MLEEIYTMLKTLNVFGSLGFQINLFKKNDITIDNDNVKFNIIGKRE